MVLLIDIKPNSLQKSFINKRALIMVKLKILLSSQQRYAWFSF
jgi:hypothetical protein